MVHQLTLGQTVPGTGSSAPTVVLSNGDTVLAKDYKAPDQPTAPETVLQDDDMPVRISERRPAHLGGNPRSHSQVVIQ